jgi:hypothetical protein
MFAGAECLVETLAGNAEDPPLFAIIRWFDALAQSAE